MRKRSATIIGVGRATLARPTASAMPPPERCATTTTPGTPAAGSILTLRPLRCWPGRRSSQAGGDEQGERVEEVAAGCGLVERRFPRANLVTLDELPIVRVARPVAQAKRLVERRRVAKHH